MHYIWQVWLEQCRSSFAQLTSDKQTREAAEAKAQDSRATSQADDLIDFVQLKSKKGLSQIEIEDEVTTGEQCCFVHKKLLFRTSQR